MYMQVTTNTNSNIEIVPFRLFNYKDDKYFIYAKSLIGTILYATKVTENGNKVVLSKPSKGELKNLYEAVNNVINNNIYDLTFFDVHSLDSANITIESEQPMDLSIDKYNVIVSPLVIKTEAQVNAANTQNVVVDKKFKKLVELILIFLMIASLLLAI